MSRRKTVAYFHDNLSWNWQEIAELLDISTKVCQRDYWKAKNAKRVLENLRNWKAKNPQYSRDYELAWRKNNPRKQAIRVKRNTLARSQKRETRRLNGITTFPVGRTHCGPACTPATTRTSAQNGDDQASRTFENI